EQERIRAQRTVGGQVHRVNPRAGGRDRALIADGVIDRDVLAVSAGGWRERDGRHRQVRRCRGSDQVEGGRCRLGDEGGRSADLRQVDRRKVAARAAKRDGVEYLFSARAKTVNKTGAEGTVESGGTADVDLIVAAAGRAAADLHIQGASPG